MKTGSFEKFYTYHADQLLSHESECAIIIVELVIYNDWDTAFRIHSHSPCGRKMYVPSRDDFNVNKKPQLSQWYALAKGVCKIKCKPCNALSNDIISHMKVYAAVLKICYSCLKPIARQSR